MHNPVSFGGEAGEKNRNNVLRVEPLRKGDKWLVSAKKGITQSMSEENSNMQTTEQLKERGIMLCIFTRNRKISGQDMCI